MTLAVEKVHLPTWKWL